MVPPDLDASGVIQLRAVTCGVLTGRPDLIAIDWPRLAQAILGGRCVALLAGVRSVWCDVAGWAAGRKGVGRCITERLDRFAGMSGEPLLHPNHLPRAHSA